MEKKAIQERIAKAEYKMTPKQKKFADEILDGASKAKAYKKAYNASPDIKTNVAASIGNQIAKTQTIREYLEAKSMDAVEVVYKLALTAQREETQLNAAKDILDRAGYKSTDQMEVNVVKRIEGIQLVAPEELRLEQNIEEGQIEENKI